MRKGGCSETERMLYLKGLNGFFASLAKWGALRGRSRARSRDSLPCFCSSFLQDLYKETTIFAGNNDPNAAKKYCRDNISAPFLSTKWSFWWGPELYLAYVSMIEDKEDLAIPLMLESPWELAQEIHRSVGKPLKIVVQLIVLQWWILESARSFLTVLACAISMPDVVYTTVLEDCLKGTALRVEKMNRDLHQGCHS